MTRQWLKGTLGIGAIVVIASGGRSMLRAQKGTEPKLPAHVVLTSQQDRQRVMDQLKITLFPSGPGAYLASTYDQNRRSLSGVAGSTHIQRRLEGEDCRAMAETARGNCRIVRSRSVWTPAEEYSEGELDSGQHSEGKTGNVAIVTKQLVGRVDNSAYPELNVTILATLSTPKDATGPVPVVLMFGGGGAAPAGVPTTTPCTLPGAAPAQRGPAPAQPARGGGAANTAAGRGAGAQPLNAPAAPRGGGTPEPSAQEQIVNRGWGYASVSTASVQADNGQGLTCGIIGLVNKGQPRSLDDWGVLSAWGWGMSKVLDYFETDKAADAKKVAVQGHSRDGKAALVALGYDERFLTGFISSSGQSGAKLHRRKYGEAIENIAAVNEYHWMAGNYLKYAGRWDTLPVDSHELIAMVAPRPVFLRGTESNYPLRRLGLKL